MQTSSPRIAGFSKGILLASVAANAALLAALAFRPSLAPAPVRDFITRHLSAGESPGAAPATPTAHATPRTAAPRGLWAAFQTDDPATLIARLRAAGFPPSIIRDLVQAEISARYDPRLRQLQETDPNIPFWKLPSSHYTRDKRYEEMTQLQNERAKLLRTLLSDDFFATDDVTAAQRRRFGELSRTKIDQLQRIEDDYTEMIAAARAGTNGIMLPEDMEKVALLNREKRADLAALLSPAELADYDMRTSQTTSLLVQRFGSFDPSEAEFRAIYQAQQALNDKYSGVNFMIGTIDDQRRLDAQKAMHDQVRASLGDQRYADYVRETNSEFQQLNRLATRENLPRETTLQAYGVRDSVERESNRIFDDPALSPDQKRASLELLAQNTRTQFNAILGTVVGPVYLKVADSWLTIIERGSAVRFETGPPLVISSGNSTVRYSGSPTYRSLGFSPTAADFVR